MYDRCEALHRPYRETRFNFQKTSKVFFRKLFTSRFKHAMSASV
jgi:hypothetical protein